MTVDKFRCNLFYWRIILDLGPDTIDIRSWSINSKLGGKKSLVKLHKVHFTQELYKN